VASFRTFRLVGGEKAGREPWRSAAALMWAEGREWKPEVEGAGLARLAWEKNINVFTTSAVGRLFDAAAALVLGLDIASFEGQGPMELEQISRGADVLDPVPLPLTPDGEGILRTDWAPLLPVLCDLAIAPEERADFFHQSMANALVDQALAVRKQAGFDAVGLSGGVFQNRRLTELVAARLEALNIEVDRYIGLAHGNGGRYMRELIADVFARHLADPDKEGSLDVSLDAAPVSLPAEGEPYMSTDGFIVQPLEFPGGDIGSLAVHGTVNDLAVSGARPLYFTLNAFIEEGLEFDCLDRIVQSLAAAAKACGVQVVAGDTKVLPRGEGGGLYLATTGIGMRPKSCDLGMHRIRPGDQVLVSGPVGDHGIAVLLAREDFDISGDVRSDNASVIDLAEAAMRFDGLCFMRDPTRAGLAGVAYEIAQHASVTIHLKENPGSRFRAHGV
jgi:hydrogenase expression/formation protein HypE